MGQKPRLSVFPIKNSPGRKLHQAHSRMRHGLAQRFRQAGFDITTEAWALLTLLWEDDGLTQSDLGDRLEKDRHNTSRLVDLLEEHGFVRRRASRKDRRIREVALTAKGRAAQAPLTLIATRFVEYIFAGLRPTEVDIFISTLEHIILRLEPRPAVPAGEVLRSTRNARRR